MFKSRTTVKNFPMRCPVCEKIVFVNQYYGGKCDNCTWFVDKNSSEFPDSVEYPNMISLNKARKLYQEGKPFKPSFEDFIEAFKIYGEVSFYYKEKEAFVCFEDHGKVYLTWDNKTNIYLNTDDFHKNARIDNKLLSEIWDEVEYADYN